MVVPGGGGRAALQAGSREGRAKAARGWRRTALACVMALLGVSSSPAQNPLAFRVIVHADNALGVMLSSEVSSIFLKRKAQWENGVPIEPVDLSGEPEVREAFSGAIHGRSTANIRSFWNQEVFSGRAVPPLELATSRDVLEYVRSHPGAIGYVSSQASLVGVRAVSVVVPPRAVRRTEPSYTTGARNAQATGDVVLSIDVDSTGNVSHITVIKEMGYGLVREAVAAVNKWKFQPATRDGMPIAATVEVTIHFSP